MDDDNTLRGLLQAAGSPMKDRETKHVFDLFERLAQRRLREAQDVGGAAQASGAFHLGNELEVTKPEPSQEMSFNGSQGIANSNGLIKLYHFTTW